MKRMYTSPVVGHAGPVVPQTQSGDISGNELAQPLLKFNMT
jgi:hypothetical protein